MFGLARGLPRWGVLSAVACLSMLAGCASAPPDRVTQTQDPWEGFNRKIYAFNDSFDKGIARPVARTYVRAVPGPARNGIHNAITNINEPVTVVNDALQGKVKQTIQDLGRFLINSTVGLLGWFDVAKHVGLPHHEEDLGETLATWGVNSGPYLVIPFIGPSTVRDAGGRLGDAYANPPLDNMPPRYRNAEIVTYGLDTRVGLMGLNNAIDEAYDPYTFVRDAYIQHRRFDIYNGNPPEEMPDYDLPPDESTSATPAATTVPKAATAVAPPAAGGEAPIK